MLEQIFIEGNISYLVFLGLAIAAFFLNKRWLRYPVMLAALATIGFLQMGCPSPVRAVQTIFSDLAQLSSSLTFVAKVVIVLVSALLAGKIFCGWVCPKGTIQEFLFRKSLRISIPPTLDRLLRYVKYVMLALLVVLPLVFDVQLFNSATSTFAVLFNLDGGLFAIVFLAATLGASLFIHRPFCRYLCPTGALLGIASQLNRVTFRTPDGCRACQRAETQCEIGALSVSQSEDQAKISVKKGECLMCGECRQNCPKGLQIKLFS